MTFISKVRNSIEYIILIYNTILTLHNQFQELHYIAYLVPFNNCLNLLFSKGGALFASCTNMYAAYSSVFSVYNREENKVGGKVKPNLCLLSSHTGLLVHLSFHSKLLRSRRRVHNCSGLQVTIETN